MSNPAEAAWLIAIDQRLHVTLEIDPRLDLRLVCGVDQAGQPMFCSISRLKPGIPELSDAVNISRTQRTLDGRWVLLLTLKATIFTDVFVQLCAHIAGRVSHTSSEAQGLAALIAGVEEWQTLLRPSANQRHSLDATRGLFGELWLGFVHLVQECSIRNVLEAWNGPFQSDQDFQFPGGPLIEVKTVHSRARRIQISSENQLDRKPNERLFIGIVTADNAMPDTPGAITVPSLLDRVDQLLQSAGVAQSELSRRLEEQHFDRSDDAYADMYFLPTGPRYLQVADTFPRIDPVKLSPGISRVSYSLDLADIAPFECDSSKLGLPDTGQKVSSNALG